MTSFGEYLQVSSAPALVNPCMHEPGGNPGMAGGAVSRAPFAWWVRAGSVLVQRVRQCPLGLQRLLSSGPLVLCPDVRGTEALFPPSLPHARSSVMPPAFWVRQGHGPPPTAGDGARGAGHWALLVTLSKVKQMASQSDLGGRLGSRTPPMTPPAVAEVLVGHLRVFAVLPGVLPHLCLTGQVQTVESPGPLLGTCTPSAFSWGIS